MICRICKKENNNDHVCKYCGSYLNPPKGVKLLFTGLAFTFVACVFSNTFMIIFLFPAIIITLVALIYLTLDAIKYQKYKINYVREKTNLEIEANRLKQAEKETQANNIDDFEIAKYYQTYSKDDSVRIKRAKYENFIIELSNDKKNAKITNAEKTNNYATTLTSCTCPDFKERKLPCKHMYRLAGELNYFDLYKKGEFETIQKLKILWDYKNLIPYLIDIFYRIRDKKNKYYVKITPNITKLQELNLILINDIPPVELAEWKYNANELKGLLYDKDLKKTISKRELANLFINDNKLIKKLPKNIKHVILNFDANQNENIIECLNYINYYN